MRILLPREHIHVQFDEEVTLSAMDGVDVDAIDIVTHHAIGHGLAGVNLTGGHGMADEIVKGQLLAGSASELIVAIEADTREISRSQEVLLRLLIVHHHRVFS